jgi:hypothetical protein
MEPALLIGVLIMCTDWRMALDPQLGSLNYSDPPRPQRAKLRTKRPPNSPRTRA